MWRPLLQLMLFRKLKIKLMTNLLLVQVQTKIQSLLGNPSHQKDQSCNICYNEVSGVKYFHHQFSTQTVQEGNKTSSLCTICRQVHSMERPLRRRILITCSTLYRCWEHTEFKPSCCFDVEAIVGGTFEDGERALRLL